MKYADAWDELKETIIQWRDMYALMDNVDAAKKKWLLESVLKQIKRLEIEYE
jgi:hypothetical protein